MVASYIIYTLAKHMPIVKIHGYLDEGLITCIPEMKTAFLHVWAYFTIQHDGCRTQKSNVETIKQRD